MKKFLAALMAVLTILALSACTTLDAQGTATRAEVAQMILKFEAI